MFLLKKTLNEVCSLFVKLRLKIMQVQIHTLGNYQFIIVTKLKILIQLSFKERMGKLLFENRVMQQQNDKFFMNSVLR